jgi:hypothetical protein
VAEQYPPVAGGQRLTGTLLREMLPQFARKTADTPRAATTTPADDPHLTFTVEANGVYECVGWVKYDGPAAADLVMNLTTPSGSAGEWLCWGAGHSPVISFTNTGVAQLDTVSARGYPIRTESLDIAAGRSLGCLGVGTELTAEIRVTLRVGSTGGTFALKWSQQTSDASPVTLFTDSMLRLTRVA